MLILSGVAQTISAKEAKRFHNTKTSEGINRVWFGPNLLAGNILSILNLPAVHVLQGSTAIFLGPIFASVMAASCWKEAMSAIESAHKAYKKTDPKFMLEDRIIKLNIIQKRIEDLLKEKVDLQNALKEADGELKKFMLN